MRQIKTFSDSRLDNMCSYCGERPDTRDHVPSKILLDEPFPENLPIVPCCGNCNRRFSLDEEYISCLIECVLNGTTNIENLKREKVKKIFRKKEALHQKIKNSIKEVDGQISFNIEVERLENVILKLAKGHAKFENSTPMLDKPKHLAIKTLHTMEQDEIEMFLANTELAKSPEVGSRAMQNFLIDSDNNLSSQWIIVQPDKYSYCVIGNSNKLIVKIIIWNYLVAEIIW